MSTWVWIVIAVGALVVLALIAFGAVRGREKRLEQRREEAQELRQEAEMRTQQALERERVAEEQAQQARESRKVAAEAGARADRIDPDRETPDD